MIKFFRWLDDYSLFTIFSALALQYQFFRLSDFFFISSYSKSLDDFYYLTTGLIFFSMMAIYNIDHWWDRRLSLMDRRSAPYVMVTLLSVSGILIFLMMGWSLWDSSFMVWGCGVGLLCGIHLFVFQSSLQKKIFFMKEISVTLLTVLGLSTPILYLHFLGGKHLPWMGMGIVFLVVLNSVLFYSWTRRYQDQERGVACLFHYLSFSQAQRFLLSLNFITLMAELLLINNENIFQINYQNRSGYLAYFPAVTVAQGLLVRWLNESSISLKRFRLLSEAIFISLLPFFLW